MKDLFEMLAKAHDLDESASSNSYLTETWNN